MTTTRHFIQEQHAGEEHTDDEAAPLVLPGSQDAALARRQRVDEDAGPTFPTWRRPLKAFWDNGVACMLTSAFTFSLASTIVKIVQSRIPVFEIVLSRALFSALTTTISCRLNRIPIFGYTAPLLLKLARGMIGATAMVLSYESIVRLPLADSTIIFFLSPIFTALLGYLLLGERFGVLTAVGCCASLCGVVMVAQPGSAAVEWSQMRLLGMAFGFGASVLAAGAYICIRQIGKREHPLTIAMYFHSFSFLFSAIPLSLGYPEPVALPRPHEAVLLLLLACCSFAANLLISRALQIEQASKASAINFAQVIFAWTTGSVFFGDPITLMGVAGTMMIAAGVTAVNFDKSTKQQATLAEEGSDKDAGQQQLPELALMLEQQGRGWWWQRWWWRRHQAAAEAVPDYSGRLKDRSIFKVDLTGLLSQYSTYGGGSPSLIQSRVPEWVQQPGKGSMSEQHMNGTAGTLLQPLPTERPV